MYYIYFLLYSGFKTERFIFRLINPLKMVSERAISISFMKVKEEMLAVKNDISRINETIMSLRLMSETLAGELNDSVKEIESQLATLSSRRSASAVSKSDLEKLKAGFRKEMQRTRNSNKRSLRSLRTRLKNSERKLSLRINALKH